MQPIRILVVLVVVTLSTNGLSQAWEDHRWDNWYFGSGGGFTFVTGGCGPLAGNVATTQNDFVTSISDPLSGELLIYTNGALRSGNHHELIPAAVFDNMNLYGQPAVVPKPGTTNRFYYIHLLPDTVDLVADSTRFNAIELDPVANGGNGAILDPGLSLGTYRGNLMCPIPSLSSDTTWLIASDRRDSLFYKYAITQTGISQALPCGTAGQLPAWPTGTDMKADRNGSKVGYRRALKFALQRFSHTTATLTDRIELSKDSFNFGFFEFSPDGEKLYVQVYYPGVPDTMPAILQYDLSVWELDAIEASRTPVAHAPQFQGGWLQLGPDGKIYSALGAADSTRIAVFNDPNDSGAACGFVPYSVALPEGITKADIGSSAICLWWPAEWPLVGLAERDGPRSNLLLQPNPAHDEVTMILSGADRTSGITNVMDMTGREVFRLLPTGSARTRLDVSDWAPGCYLVQHTNTTGLLISSKLIVE